MDINNDSILDVFIGNSYGKILYYAGTAVGSMELNDGKIIYESGDKNVTHVPFYPYDWDGDGLIDIIILQFTFKIIKNIGTVSNPVFDTDNLLSVSIKDDNQEELVLSQSGYGRAAFNVGDVNNDGLMDIVTTKNAIKKFEGSNSGTYTTEIKVYYNTGNTQFPAFDYSFAVHDTSGIFLGEKSRVTLVDINDDKAIDIIASERYSGGTWKLIIWEGIPEVTPISKLQTIDEKSSSFFYNNATKTFLPNKKSKLRNFRLVTLKGQLIDLIPLSNGGWKIPSNISKGVFIAQQDNGGKLIQILK